MEKSRWVVQCTKNQYFFRKSIGAVFFLVCYGPRIQNVYLLLFCYHYKCSNRQSPSIFGEKKSQKLSKQATFLQRLFKNYLISTLKQKFYQNPCKDANNSKLLQKDPIFVSLLNNKLLQKTKFNTYGCHFGQKQQKIYFFRIAAFIIHTFFF